MLLILQRCPPIEHADEELVLPFEFRQKSRLRAQLASGEEIGLFLERGSILRGGECLLAEDGRIVKVTSQPERILEVRCVGYAELAKAAYHLGNRHVAVQIGEGWLRLASDPVLREMLQGLGLVVLELEAAFEPEAGAYGGEHPAPLEQTAAEDHSEPSPDDPRLHPTLEP